MRLKCFSIPALEPDAATEDVSRFLAEHRVLGLERRFVEDGAASYWAICVTYQARSASASASSSVSGSAARKPKVDYREVLTEPEFALFAKLRALRKTLSDRENVPAYALFTNEQLASMVRDRVRDTKGLAAISGVGQARVEKYGKAFLGLMREQLTDLPPTESTDAPS